MIVLPPPTPHKHGIPDCWDGPGPGLPIASGRRQSEEEGHGEIRRLALLGIGLLIGGFPVWLGWLTLGADVVFLAGYLRFRDIPPFVFYLLLLLVGLVMV